MNSSTLKLKTEEFIHDIRSPITSINGFAELLLEDASITGSSKEYLQIVLGETGRLSSMIKEFSKAIEKDA